MGRMERKSAIATHILDHRHCSQEWFRVSTNDRFGGMVSLFTFTDTNIYLNQGSILRPFHTNVTYLNGKLYIKKKCRSKIHF